MYKLVHTHTKSEIAYAHSYVTHTFYISPQYQAFSKSRERYHNSSKWPKTKCTYYAKWTNAKVMHDSAQLSYKGYTNKKY